MNHTLSASLFCAVKCFCPQPASCHLVKSHLHLPGTAQGHLLPKSISESLLRSQESRVTEVVIWSVFDEPGAPGPGFKLPASTSCGPSPGPCRGAILLGLFNLNWVQSFTSRALDGGHVGRSIGVLLPKPEKKSKHVSLVMYQMRRRKEETAWGHGQPSEGKTSIRAQWNTQDLFFKYCY